MADEQSGLKKFWAKLQKSSRYVVLNNETFEEERAFTLSPLSLIIYVLFGFLIALLVAFLVFSYTPLNSLIPKGPSSSSEAELLRVNKENLIKIEQLEKKSQIDEQYLRNIRALLNGEQVEWDTQSNTTIDSINNYETVNIESSSEDSVLRDLVDQEEKYNVGVEDEISTGNNDMKGVFFFSPLKGEVTNSFGGEANHIGVDIIAPKNEAVKSTLNGTVIFTGWTSDNGHVIHVQHSNNLVSVYKHNSVLLKTTGERVKAGEPIAIVGNTGDLSTGAHLHFELWYNGSALDPQQFIAF